jgi:hypothetical protein
MMKSPAFSIRWRAVLARPATVPCLVVIGVVVLANFLYLSGLFDPNPLHQLTGLTSGRTPGLLPGLDTIDPNIGYTGQALGHLAAHDWLHGTFPWWNPYEGLGAPLAGEMQSAALFPLVLLEGFGSGQVFVHVILEITAGLSMYFLLRRLVKSQIAATAGAVAFALNGTFSWIFDQIGNPVAFAPLLILGIEQARRPGRARTLSGWPLIAVALALSIYAGFPEVTFIDCVLGGLWALVRGSELRGEDLIGFGRRLLAGLTVGLLLAAPILVAFATFLSHGDVGAHSSYSRISLDPATALPAKILPYVFGPIFGWIAPTQDHTRPFVTFWGNAGGYFGAALFVLGLVGLMGPRLRRLRVVLALWILVGILGSVGVHWARDLVNLIPGISTTWFARYALPSWSLALTVLAALGIDDLIQRRIRWQPLVAGGVAIAAIGLAGHEAEQALRSVQLAPHHHLWAAASIAWGSAIVVACAIGGALLRDRQVRGSFVSALLVLDCMALFVVPQVSAPRQASIDMGPVHFLQTHLGSSRFASLGPIQPNYGSYWELSSINVNDLPIPKPFASYVTNRLNDNIDPTVFVGTQRRDAHRPGPVEQFVSHLAGYEAAGVKYVVLRTGTALPGLPAKTTLPVVYQDHLVTIRELPDPAPLFSASGGGCVVRTSGLAAASVDCLGPGTLVYRELYLPGWRAQDNGGSLAIRHDIFQAVALHSGHNDVTFSFAPPYITWALLGLFFGMAILVAAGTMRALHRQASWPVRRRPPRSAAEETSPSDGDHRALTQDQVT